MKLQWFWYLFPEIPEIQGNNQDTLPQHGEIAYPEMYYNNQ